MSEATRRALRTALQVFVGVFAAVLLSVLRGYAASHYFDWETLYYEGVILGVAAVVAWAMNRK